MDIETFLREHRMERDLADVQMLRGLPRELAAKIAHACVWRVYPAGTVILAQDDPTRDVMFVRHGRVRILQFTPSGREIGFAEVLSGGHFGEIAAIDGGSRSATAVAVEDTVTANLAGSEFLALLGSTPALTLNVMRAMARIIRLTNLRVNELRGLTAPGRVIHELLLLAQKAGQGADRRLVRLEPAPTQSEIASLAGTTRETVARTLSDLEHRGLVRRGGRSLELLRLEGLEDLLEESIQSK
ncbi:MAG: Crp/Fnr family transcriptional regulator [Proteobacteria bacterium]|nr:Crp/Fnr family transcriptional regulator [Pseudomonadota bacterium]MBI3499101.1 Crp/Fnr family transcriptional regulator [Pseudomonadota bacterium]